MNKQRHWCSEDCDCQKIQMTLSQKLDKIEEEIDGNVVDLSANETAILEDTKRLYRTLILSLLREEMEACVPGPRMGGEFGFCPHCKFHKGDYEHDFGICAGHDLCREQTLKNIKERLEK